jgi:hypothetical protein
MTSTLMTKESGLSYKDKSYGSLNYAYTYSCGDKNANYKGINNNVNCTCVLPQERTSYDKAVITGSINNWMQNTSQLDSGWTKYANSC